MASSCIVSTAPNATLQTAAPTNTLRGWLYFAQNLSKAKWQDNSSDSDILDAIAKGPGAMPGYADTLSATEQLALVKAVRDLRKP
ncbi:MAG TPA: hypothetical protein VFE95_12410 [Pseudomonas sp.]|nr:hypothetical protein [Pseudomonas sp.]